MFTGWRLWLPLYVAIAVASGFMDLRARAYPDRVVTHYVPEVVSGRAEAPGRYRILAPWVVHVTAVITGWKPMTAWIATRLVWLLAAYLVLHAYLRTWFGLPATIAGTLLVAATLPLTFTNSWANPDHIPELALFTWGCLAIAKRDDGLFALVLPLATLNRETAAFLLLLYAVAEPLSRGRLIRLVGFGVLWAALYIGLRLLYGFQHYEYWQVWRNLEFLKLLPPNYDPYYRAYAWFGVLLFGPLVWLGLHADRTAPLFVRRALWVVPAVVIVAFTISSIIESRIFTPLYPLTLPAALFGLFGRSGLPEGRNLREDSVPSSA
jgi:hypothetical protein